MNTKLFFGTLAAAAALATPAFADDPSKDLTTFSISQNNPSVTLTNGSGLYNINLSGSGTMVISCDAIKENPATMSSGGTISGDGAIFVQLNGGGYLTIYGTVTLEGGGYIAYQGSTTFSNNTVKLGSIEFYQENDTICDVVFSGSTAEATVGTITVDETTGSLTATLTVENGATLKITGTDALVINDDFDITIDAGTMAIGGSATGSKSANITIKNGGQLSVTSEEEISLNNATIEIVLSTDNISSTVDPNSVLTTYATGDGVYALTGDGSLEDVTIKITVDEALASLLKSGDEYTLCIYEGLTLDSVTWDTTDLDQYGITWDGGTIITGATPEPSMFGLMFGLGAIAFTATRRRKRKVA